jgi:23S rRNA pseudouridine1911/1915/1917 synthase
MPVKAPLNRSAGMGLEPVALEVDVALAGQRLDHALAVALPGISRTRVRAAIEAGRVHVNGKPAKASLRLDEGMRIDVLPAEALPGRQPDHDLKRDRVTPSRSSAPLRVVYEDDDLLVVDKPAGMVVHPAPGHEGVTLVDEVRSRVGELWMTDDARPGIVHRLDKDTSGLLVVAKNPASHAALADQMKARTTVKRYLALVEGRMTVPEGVIDAPIGRDPRNRQRMAVVRAGSPGAREARTRFRTLHFARGRTLLEVQLETGRTHQIRVHLAAIHHPIVGDGTYGQSVAPPQPPRQFLHAAHLEFAHPRSQLWMTFDSPLPPDLATFALPWLPGQPD